MTSEVLEPGTSCLLSSEERHEDDDIETQMDFGLPHECLICESKFREEYELKAHIVFFHSRKLFRCFECRARYTTKEKLDIHFSTIHEGKKVFSDSQEKNNNLKVRRYTSNISQKYL